MHVLLHSCFLVHCGCWARAEHGMCTAPDRKLVTAATALVVLEVAEVGERDLFHGLCVQMFVRKVCGSTSVRVTSASECLVARQTCRQHVPAGQGVSCNGRRVPLLP